jgi:hypothetical protein
MIKKQYRRSEPGYFGNFISANDPNGIIEDELRHYQATIAKSKNRHYIMNVKWHNKELYMLFVLRWS